jgi:hypothetical protein
MLSETALSRHFARLGARFLLNHSPTPRGWALDVVRDEEGPAFELRAGEMILTDIEVIVSNVDRTTRHLLLLVRERADAPLHRYLCGHDERDWFLATVPGGVTTVAQALQALKPEPVLQAQESAHLKGKQRNRRHNSAFLRQGEWFFLPAPGLNTAGRPIHRWEPIRRGGGKAHLVQELVRLGGKVVYFNGRVPAVAPVASAAPAAPPQTMSAEEFATYRKQIGPREAANWRSGVQDARVYARGLVRHPDHATLVLNGWHEVLANTEAQASVEALRRLAFID